MAALTPRQKALLEKIEKLDFALLEKQLIWLGEAIDWKSDDDKLGQGLWHFLHALLDADKSTKKR